jgi:hypothetical protein
MIKSGVFRYIRLGEVADRLNSGWRYAAHLGQPHGQYSVLMWWCCGDCKDDEVPA